MTFLFDENIAKQIVEALRALDWDAVHALEVVKQGTDDITLLARVAHEGWYFVSQDQRITRHPVQRKALIDLKIGAFFFTGRAERSLTELAILILTCQYEMLEKANRTKRPFIYGISDRRKFERLD